MPFHFHPKKTQIHIQDHGRCTHSSIHIGTMEPFTTCSLGAFPPSRASESSTLKNSPGGPGAIALAVHHDLNDVVNGDGFPDDVFAEGLATKHMEEMAFFMGSLKGSRYSIFCRSMVPIEFLYQQKTILSMWKLHSAARKHIECV